MVARTSLESASALELGAWKIGMAMAFLLERRLRIAYSSAPSSTRATSPSRTISPSSPVLMTMSRNCCSSVRRPWALMASSNCAFCAGGAPIWPAATCTFCSRMALMTSPLVSPRAASFCGSSHTRME